jgi:quercetin dioxygenase-like cupin family protein
VDTLNVADHSAEDKQMTGTEMNPSANEGNGEVGQKQLAAGKSVSMRLWENEPPTEQKQETQREYEIVGYVLKGKAELYCDGKKISLAVGDSWVVPSGSKHRYQILEPFTAVEAVSPPANLASAKNNGDSDQADDKKAKAASKSEQAKDVAAEIPRTSENITSNSPEKERQPAEHEDLEK